MIIGALMLLILYSRADIDLAIKTTSLFRQNDPGEQYIPLVALLIVHPGYISSGVRPAVASPSQPRPIRPSPGTSEAYHLIHQSGRHGVTQDGHLKAYEGDASTGCSCRLGFSKEGERMRR